MKGLKRSLGAMVKQLEVLAAKAERLAAQVEKLENAQEKAAKAASPRKPAKKAATKKPAKKAAPKKPARATAGALVLSILKRQKKPAGIVFLKERTGFDDHKLRTVIYRLKKQGKIMSPGRGLYAKVK